VLYVRARNAQVTLITGKVYVSVMEGEVRDSFILTQEQLDELAAVFKSVSTSLRRSSFW